MRPFAVDEHCRTGCCKEKRKKGKGKAAHPPQLSVLGGKGKGIRESRLRSATREASSWKKKVPPLACCPKEEKEKEKKKIAVRNKPCPGSTTP